MKKHTKYSCKIITCFFILFASLAYAQTENLQGFGDKKVDASGIQSLYLPNFQWKFPGNGFLEVDSPDRTTTIKICIDSKGFAIFPKLLKSETSDGTFEETGFVLKPAKKSDVFCEKGTVYEAKVTLSVDDVKKRRFFKVRVKNMLGQTISQVVTLYCNPAGSRTQTNIVKQFPASDVDSNLPLTKTKNDKALALLVGNANYKNFSSVDFAINDALSMKKYLVKVLGYRSANVKVLKNATLADFIAHFGQKGDYKGWLYNQLRAQDSSDVFIFYAGHGAPGLTNSKNGVASGFFVPTDASIVSLERVSYPQKVFFENIAKLPARSVTVVLDACFSGAGAGKGKETIKNISSIGIKAKGMKGVKNGVLFTSSSKDEPSRWYSTKYHGLFTYYFLNALKNLKATDQNNDGRITYRELYKNIIDGNNLPFALRKLHDGNPQTPQISGKNKDEIFLEY